MPGSVPGFEHRKQSGNSDAGRAVMKVTTNRIDDSGEILEIRIELDGQVYELRDTDGSIELTAIGGPRVLTIVPDVLRLSRSRRCVCWKQCISPGSHRLDRAASSSHVSILMRWRTRRRINVCTMNKARRNKARKRRVDSRLGPMIERLIGRPDGSELVLRYRGKPGEEPRPRAVCFCVYSVMQSCHICDPEGKMFAVVRPELSVLLIG